MRRWQSGSIGCVMLQSAEASSMLCTMSLPRVNAEERVFTDDRPAKTTLYKTGSALESTSNTHLCQQHSDIVDVDGGHIVAAFAQSIHWPL